jgi:hypothetical protein
MVLAMTVFALQSCWTMASCSATLLVYRSPNNYKGTTWSTCSFVHYSSFRCLLHCNSHMISIHLMLVASFAPVMHVMMLNGYSTGSHADCCPSWPVWSEISSTMTPVAIHFLTDAVECWIACLLEAFM